MNSTVVSPKPADGLLDGRARRWPTATAPHRSRPPRRGVVPHEQHDRDAEDDEGDRAVGHPATLATRLDTTPWRAANRSTRAESVHDLTKCSAVGETWPASWTVRPPETKGTTRPWNIHVRTGDALATASALAVVMSFEGATLPSAVGAAFETGRLHREPPIRRSSCTPSAGARPSACCSWVSAPRKTADHRAHPPGSRHGDAPGSHGAGRRHHRGRAVRHAARRARASARPLAEGLELGAYRYLQHQTGARRPT